MFRRATAGQSVGFGLVDLSGAAAADATVTVYRVIDGGEQAVATGTVTNKGNGQYRFSPSAADIDGLQISYWFTAPDVIPVEKTVVTDGHVVSDIVAAVTSGTVITVVPTSQILDRNGDRVTAISLRDAIAVLLVGLLGDRAGLGTSSVTATMPGVENVRIEATRASNSAVEAAVTIPGAQ